MFDSATTWIAGALIITNIYSGATSWSKGKDIQTLQQEVEKLVAINVVSEQNTVKCKASLSKQNKAILDLQADVNASRVRWENREDRVEYVDRWRTRYIDRNVTGDSCEETMLILDAIRDGGF